MLLGRMVCGWRVRTRPAALTVVCGCGIGCVVEAVSPDAIDGSGVLLVEEEDAVVFVGALGEERFVPAKVDAFADWLGAVFPRSLHSLHVRITSLTVSLMRLQ